MFDSFRKSICSNHHMTLQNQLINNKLHKITEESQVPHNVELYPQELLKPLHLEELPGPKGVIGIRK